MKFESAKKYRFLLEPRYFYYGWSNSSDIIGRTSLLKALAHARTLLPKGYNFKIWDLQRPRYVQLQMIKSFERRLRLSHPDWSQKTIASMVVKFGAKPLLKVMREDTHRLGGAVDLTIVDRLGNELPMGTDHDDLTERASTRYYEDLKHPKAIEILAKKNRRLLIKTMARAGFSNHPSEWWHWSYPV